MQQTAVFPGRYVQEEGALSQLGAETARLGSKPMIVAGGTAERSIIPRFEKQWSQHLNFRIAPFGGESSDEEFKRLANLVSHHNSDCIIGMGGGKVLDTAKAVAFESKVPVAIVPTIASTDAPCSAVSVVYTPKGYFKRYLFLPRNPELVLVDTQVIARAPVRFLVAGMGDALATWFEAESCRRAGAPNQCGGLGTLAAYQLAQLCYDTVIENGVAAKTACESGIVTPALSYVVEANTLLSGLGFECGGLAAAHSIHNGLTVLGATHSFYHGEKVAFGVLASLFLNKYSTQLIDTVYGFCEAVGLPITLGEIGLEQLEEEELIKVAERTCVDGETIHHEPRPVSPQSVVAALKTADATGRDRKKAMSQ